MTQQPSPLDQILEKLKILEESSKKKSKWERRTFWITAIISLTSVATTYILARTATNFEYNYRKSESKRKGFEMFNTIYPKLLSNDTLERESARIIVEGIAHQFENDSLIEISIKLLKLKDSVRANQMIKNIIKDPETSPALRRKVTALIDNPPPRQMPPPPAPAFSNNDRVFITTLKKELDIPAQSTIIDAFLVIDAGKKTVLQLTIYDVKIPDDYTKYRYGITYRTDDGTEKVVQFTIDPTKKPIKK